MPSETAFHAEIMLADSLYSGLDLHLRDEFCNLLFQLEPHGEMRHPAIEK